MIFNLDTVTRADVSVHELAEYEVSPLNENAIAVLDDAVQQLEGHDIHYWVDSGTLLGMVRDNALITHDTDIDINVALDTPSLPLLVGFTPIRMQVYAEIAMQIAYMKGGVILDIYPHYASDTSPGTLVNINEYGIIAMPAHFITKREPVAFHGKQYLAPQPVEEYLTWRYGTDWKTPKKQKDHWVDDATHIRGFV